MPLFAFRSRHGKQKETNFLDAPPEWAPAPETSHTLGLYNEATDDEYESAERFCEHYPVDQPKLLPSDIVERIESEGCKAWKLEWPRSPRFVGHVEDTGEKGGNSAVSVMSKKECRDTCLFSDLPILAGLYDIQGKSGVYYEVVVHKMEGIIAIGTACRPYPEWRFPGWNRLSAGLHLDDMRKFFEDPDGGRDYSPLLNHISPGDTIGCGYDFARSCIFYTHNGQRLSDAFTGIYVPRTSYDVYAAIGVEGNCKFDVNFGGELFRWKEGNEWSWRVEGHVGRLSGGSGIGGDELPTYDEVRRR
ncbi:unnamed protein product [Somion occarium]|uniref:B30.2/SPRY domain-containing protein n=1 Tax=Somion occarium TaxID=3059160 RepID=A0ABP1DY89_9APHY